VAAGTVAVGSFLPWASAGGGLLKASGSGIEGGDGWITLIIGAAAALVAVRALLQSRKPHAGLLATTGIAAAAVAAAELVSILSRPGTTIYGVNIKASPDLGLLAVAAGGIALVVIAVAANRDDPERAAPPCVAAGPTSKGGLDVPPSAKGVPAEVRLHRPVGDHFECPGCGDSASIRTAMAERDRLVVDWLQTPLDRWNAFDRLLQESTKPMRAETLQRIADLSFDDVELDLVVASHVWLLDEAEDGYVAAGVYCPACYRRREASLREETLASQPGNA
jgi:hypothetical protein